MRILVNMLLYIKNNLPRLSQASDEHAWHLLSLPDAVRQRLPLDLFGLLLNVADKLFREFNIVQSKVEVACCEEGGSRRAWCRATGSGVTSWGSPVTCHMVDNGTLVEEV